MSSQVNLLEHKNMLETDRQPQLKELGNMTKSESAPATASISLSSSTPSSPKAAAAHITPLTPLSLVPPRSIANLNASRRSSAVSDGSNGSLISNSSHISGSSFQPDWVQMDIDKFGKSFYKDEQPLNEHVLNLKERALKNALLHNQPPSTFKEFSKTTDGLINNHLRSQIWPILLGIKQESTSKFSLGMIDDLDSADLPPHSDEDQVKLDVQRSFNVLTSSKDSYTTILSGAEIEQLKKRLFHLIVRVLRKHPSLHYYQGYHDVASIVLLVAIENENTGGNSNDIAFDMLERITLYHLRDFMLKEMDLTVDHLRLIPALLEQVDLGLFSLVKLTGSTNDYNYIFYPALSSILTQFSHDIPNFHQVLAVWDFVWSYDSILVNIYIYVATLLHFKDNIFDALAISDIDTSIADSAMTHTMISPTNLFGNLTDQDVVKILAKTKSLLEEFPVASFAAGTFDVWFEEFNPSSVLLTTSNFYLSTRELTSLSDTISTQEVEIARQMAHESKLALQLALEREMAEDKSSADEYYTDYSSNPSLASSITLASASTSIASLTSSFKKIFVKPEDEPEKKLVKRNPYTSLFKISVTVGFVGFLAHFVIVKTNPNFYSQGAFKSVMDPLWRFTSQTVGGFSHNLSQSGSSLASDVYKHVRESDFMQTFGQVGIGNMRSSAWGN